MAVLEDNCLGFAEGGDAKFLLLIAGSAVDHPGIRDDLGGAALWTFARLFHGGCGLAKSVAALSLGAREEHRLVISCFHMGNQLFIGPVWGTLPHQHRMAIVGHLMPEA